MVSVCVSDIQQIEKVKKYRFRGECRLIYWTKHSQCSLITFMSFLTILKFIFNYFYRLRKEDKITKLLYTPTERIRIFCYYFLFSLCQQPIYSVNTKIFSKLKRNGRGILRLCVDVVIWYCCECKCLVFCEIQNGKANSSYVVLNGWVRPHLQTSSDCDTSKNHLENPTGILHKFITGTC